MSQRETTSPPSNTKGRLSKRAVHATLFSLAALAVLPVGALRAQTIEDGVLMPRGDFCTGFLYQHDRWDEYWEGTLKRDNGNIGTLTTQSVAWVGNYGVTDRLNVIAMLPYVWTDASQGVLNGMSGFQDLTVAAKYNLLDHAVHQRRLLQDHRGRRRGDAHQRLHARLPAAVHRAREPPRVGAPDAALQGQAGVVPQRLLGLHLARQGDAGPPGLLHRRRALPTATRSPCPTCSTTR